MSGDDSPFEWDDAAAAIAGEVARFARERGAEAWAREPERGLRRALWRELAELGVLGLGAPGGEGGPAELAAACEALGECGFPGPLIGQVFAAQVLAEPEREAVVAGQRIACCGEPPLLPWAPEADLFVLVRGGRAWRAEPEGEVVAVPTLAGERWGRVELRAGAELEGVAAGLLHADLARAAWLVGAAGALLDTAAAHARTRVQFGRPIGEFQAVAHPLARCWTRLAAARALLRLAARSLAESGASAAADVGAARLSATAAALGCAETAHQTLGALGITLEGPLFHLSRRVRQLASEPPSDDAARAALLAELA